jgi:hypothetical protein
MCHGIRLPKGALLGGQNRLLYRGIGDKDKVFHWFELALQQREPTLVTLKVDPANDSLRSDPRFQRLLDRLKL